MGEKRGIMASKVVTWTMVIIVLIIVISLFTPIFKNDNSERQECRQSIVVRAGFLPDVKWAGWNTISFKEAYPLKCQAEVVKITKEDVAEKRAGEIIARTILECWALYDYGDKNLFPTTFFSNKTSCVPCARISLTSEAKSYLIEKEESINIENALVTKGFEGNSYLNHLNNDGKKFPAFNLGGGNEFNLSGEYFDVSDDNSDVSAGYIRNRETGESEGLGYFFNLLEDRIYFSKISLPREMNPTSGDLLIAYGSLTTPKSRIGDNVPYLFYFQQDQMANGGKNPLEIVKDERLIQGGDSYFTSNYNEIFVCNSWDGVFA